MKSKSFFLISGVVSVVIISILAFFSVFQSSLILDGRQSLYLDQAGKNSFVINFVNSEDYVARDYGVVKGLSVVDSFSLVFVPVVDGATNRVFGANLADIWTGKACINHPEARDKSSCCSAYGFKRNYAEVGSGVRAYACYNDVVIPNIVSSVSVNGIPVSVSVLSDGSVVSADLSILVNSACSGFVGVECKLPVVVSGSGVFNVGINGVSLVDNAPFVAPVLDVPIVNDSIVSDRVCADGLVLDGSGDCVSSTAGSTVLPSVPTIFWIVLVGIVVIFVGVIAYARKRK